MFVAFCLAVILFGGGVLAQEQDQEQEAEAEEKAVADDSVETETEEQPATEGEPEDEDDGRPVEIAPYDEQLTRNPRDAAAWYGLARKMVRDKHRVPAFLAYVRYLAMEPTTKRAAAVAEHPWELLFMGVKTWGRDRIYLDKTELDVWLQSSMMLSVTATMRGKGRGQGMSKPEFFASALEGMTLMFDTILDDPGVDPFWKRMVVGFFVDAREAGHLEALAYVSRQSLEERKVKKWIKANAEAVERYKQWAAAWKPAPPAEEPTEEPTEEEPAGEEPAVGEAPAES